MSNNIFTNNLVSTNTIVTVPPIMPRIFLQMSIEAISPAYGGACRYIIFSPTTGFLSSSSGAFIITPTSGRVSVPVSGIYSINAWVFLTVASWLYIVINGTQTVDDITSYPKPFNSPSVVGASYNSNATLMTSWTGYLSITDYFYISTRDGAGTVQTTYPRGLTVSLVG